MNVIFATANKDKMAEIREILDGMHVVSSVQSMKEAGIDIDIEENGETFEENAMIKARAVFDAAREKGLENILVLADDSGLCVEALGGEPGIYSARYMGKDTSYRIKNANLIERVNKEGHGNRNAQFVCCIAAVFPDGSEKVVRGVVDGEIADKEYGENGFGFDPIFYVPRLHCTTAQLKPEEKHAISHRGNALRMMRKVISEYEGPDSK
ncbi:MAG: RdgB/HAM1 family non-canonical purine NTP pyrophosphatase [Lachnospiraceae bacterium]|nr:RdgB/HAM1 family non-canonical purine NTP pyrophosphatase [Lachnospiraceae bacterium]